VTRKSEFEPLPPLFFRIWLGIAPSHDRARQPEGIYTLIVLTSSRTYGRWKRARPKINPILSCIIGHLDIVIHISSLSSSFALVPSSFRSGHRRDRLFITRSALALLAIALDILEHSHTHLMVPSHRHKHKQDSLASFIITDFSHRSSFQPNPKDFRQTNTFLGHDQSSVHLPRNRSSSRPLLYMYHQNQIRRFRSSSVYVLSIFDCIEASISSPVRLSTLESRRYDSIIPEGFRLDTGPRKAVRPLS